MSVIRKKEFPVDMRIQGFTVPVEFLEGLIDVHGSYGYFHVVDNEIALDDELSDEVAVSSLLHETLEALNHLLKLELDHDDQLVKLETGLYQVLKDNKAFRELFDG